jgi:hypothetical protein
MTKKCYVGNPIEFKAKYEGDMKCKSDPDMGGTICGVGAKNFAWLQQQVDLGKGFYAKADLPNGIEAALFAWDPSQDLELVVTGPGLPANGKRLTFNWVSSACMGLLPDTMCKQFLGVQSVNSKSGASEYTTEFVSGNNELQYPKLGVWNTATWTICYRGPFEVIWMADPAPQKQVIVWIPPWIWGTIEGVKKLEAAAEADVDIKPPRDTIDTVVAKMDKIQIPVDQQKLRNDIIESLKQTRTELGEADSLLKRSNRGALKEKQELRATATGHLERAHEFGEKAIELLSDLEGALKSKRWCSFLPPSR